MCLRVMATKPRGGEEEGKRAPDSERLRNPSCQGLLFHGLVSRRNKLLDKPVGGCHGWFSIGGHVRVFFVARYRVGARLRGSSSMNKPEEVICQCERALLSSIARGRDDP